MNFLVRYIFYCFQNLFDDPIATLQYNMKYNKGFSIYYRKSRQRGLEKRFPSSHDKKNGIVSG